MNPSDPSRMGSSVRDSEKMCEREKKERELPAPLKRKIMG